VSIDLTLEDHVARTTINRPDVLNAIDTKTERLLLRAWETIEADDAVRAVILTGAGDRAFCVGADMSDGDDASAIEYWATTRPQGFGGIALRRTLDVPVIARVNGYALGGGMEMVLGCDIVIAADHAEFGLPEPRVGRIPLDGGVSTLVRRIPPMCGRWSCSSQDGGSRPPRPLASGSSTTSHPPVISMWSSMLSSVRYRPVHRCRCGLSSRSFSEPGT